MAEPRLTNTVALAALRSRRYFNRYFSFWLFLGNFFILALLDSGVRGSEVRPPNKLMIRPQFWSFGPRKARSGGKTTRRRPALPRSVSEGCATGSCARALPRVTSGWTSGGRAAGQQWTNGGLGGGVWLRAAGRC